MEGRRICTTPDDLISVLEEKPSVPLVLRITTGEVFEIRHPELVIITDADTLLIATPSDRQRRHRVRHIGLDDLVEFASATKRSHEDDNGN